MFSIHRYSFSYNHHLRTEGSIFWLLLSMELLLSIIHGIMLLKPQIGNKKSLKFDLTYTLVNAKTSGRNIK